jgi:hypothetical protein
MDGDIVISIHGDGECRIATSGGKLHGEKMVEVVGLFSSIIDTLNNEPNKRRQIFAAIDRERKRQDEKWGEQNHEMLRCERADVIKESLKHFRLLNDHTQTYDWYTIIQEEIAEAFLETDPEKQREELVQVAAVAVKIIEYLNRKKEAEK